MTVPADLKYTESHEWVRREADGTVTVPLPKGRMKVLGFASGKIAWFEAGSSCTADA